jgi:hypothetical protein
MLTYYTPNESYDGFGAQYQRRIQTYIYCNMNNLNFVYNPLRIVEHNYNNDNDYNDKLENLMNLKNNIININGNINFKTLDYGSIVMPFFEKNIDICCENKDMKFIKDSFWENKDKNFFNNNKFNVAIHIRRENHVDKGIAGDRVTTPNSYYLNVMNNIRNKHKDKNILFHIYSQGKIENFIDLASDNVMFYINYDIIETFKGLVSSEALVISPSSLSYVAALISDGEIYYKNFWHKPRSSWTICG